MARLLTVEMQHRGAGVPASVDLDLLEGEELRSRRRQIAAMVSRRSSYRQLDAFDGEASHEHIARGAGSRCWMN